MFPGRGEGEARIDFQLVTLIRAAYERTATALSCLHKPTVVEIEKLTTSLWNEVADYYPTLMARFLLPTLTNLVGEFTGGTVYVATESHLPMVSDIVDTALASGPHLPPGLTDLIMSLSHSTVPHASHSM
jgi:hypothetical protein